MIFLYRKLCIANKIINYLVLQSNPKHLTSHFSHFIIFSLFMSSAFHLARWFIQHQKLCLDFRSRVIAIVRWHCRSHHPSEIINTICNTWHGTRSVTYETVTSVLLTPSAHSLFLVLCRAQNGAAKVERLLLADEDGEIAYHLALKLNIELCYYYASSNSVRVFWPWPRTHTKQQ